MWFRALRVVAGAILLLAVTAAPAGAVATATFIPSEQEVVPSCEASIPFDPSDFAETPRDDNWWLPLKPNTQYVLEGQSNRGGGLLPHRVVFTVTDLTKKINGVNTRVLWDVDINQGQVSEAELAFFAEDWADNVWLFGEYPEEYEGGLFKGAPNTWLAGSAGAEAGVQVPSYFSLSGTPYVQGFAPSVGFFDCGKDIIKGESTCVPYGCFGGVAVVEEWSPLDPEGGFQRKLYARKVGNISIGAVNDPEGETLVLTQRSTLTPEAAQQAHDEALKLDERAYLVSDVWSNTDPAQPGGKRPPPPLPSPTPVNPGPPAVPIAAATTSKKKKAKKRKRCRSKRRAHAKRKSASKRKRSGTKRRRCGAKKKRRR
jgi:hypothetical protein